LDGGKKDMKVFKEDMKDEQVWDEWSWKSRDKPVFTTNDH